MVPMLIILWSISIIIFITDTKSESNKWVSFTFFSLGIGLFSDLLKRFLIPYLSNNYPSKLGVAITILGILYSFSYYIPFYSILMFSLIHSNKVNFNDKIRFTMIKIFLLLPIILMFILVPNSQVIPYYKTNFILLATWTIPYMFVSYKLLIDEYKRETDKLKKIEDLVITLFAIPAFTILTISDNIIPIFIKIDSTPVYLSIVIYLVGCTSFLLIRASFFGAKVSFERNKNIYENRIINSSLLMLNHSIKNEVSKISYCATYLNEFSKMNDKDSIDAVDIISSSSNHILEMIKKFNFHAQEIIINNEYISLNNLVSETISQNKFQLENKDILFNNNIPDDILVYCDKIHFNEVINNLIKNSIDAIKNKGSILINSQFDKKHLIITVKDDGCGVDKNHIKNIKEPFFTTKNNAQNYGMGLFYCSKVIEKYKGIMEIESEYGVSTKVQVFLPYKYLKFINAKS